MPSIDPKRSMRPYRKVDMGNEIENLVGRVGKLERLEAQVRVVQWLVGALLVSVLGIGIKECQARDTKRVDDAGVKMSIESHLRQPHNQCEAGIETINGVLLDYGERLRVTEERLYIRKKKR